MATITFCSGCGTALDLADLADNRCHKCGQSVEFHAAESVEGVAVVEKICCICGTNVAGQPRMKDKTGAYFCIPCGKADSAKKHSVGTACKDCDNKFPEEQLHMHNGERVCEKCLIKRREKQRENSRKFRAQAYADEKSYALHLQIAAGIAALVIAALIWYF